MIDQDEMINVMTVRTNFFLAANKDLFQSLYKMLEGMGNRPSGDPKIRAKDIFSLIDLNNDGTLTVEEFVKGEIILHKKYI